MADRVGVINKGELILVEDKHELMRKLGQKRLTLILETPLAAVPQPLAAYPLVLSEDGRRLVYSYGAEGDGDGVAKLLHDVAAADISFKDVLTEQSSLEDIFVGLVRGAA